MPATHVPLAGNISDGEWQQFLQWRRERQREAPKNDVEPLTQGQDDTTSLPSPPPIVILDGHQIAGLGQPVEAKAEGEGEDGGERRQKSDSPSSPKKRKGKKRSFGREYKLEAISYLENGTMRLTPISSETPVSVRHCAKRYGVEPKNIRDWRRQLQKIRDSETGSKCIGSGRKPDWPEMEGRLHRLFAFEREKGKKIEDSTWFFTNGKDIFEQVYPEHVVITPEGGKRYTLNISADTGGLLIGWDRWSRGWFDGFKRRKGITFKPTNKKRKRPGQAESVSDGDFHDAEGEYIQT
ncbi:hypothetical protein C7212DRAFT_360971 [Tuber magnatum]|uniref:HTH CENPB-type domain-containing protein n=1 Tax=Tuber magnatum TaxID=42249 RepID=A0A317SZA6_9PEZI|nr:hypothetical protein C7212DRAFT_360971 [Tuber magnatum]